MARSRTTSTKLLPFGTALLVCSLPLLGCAPLDTSATTFRAPFDTLGTDLRSPDDKNKRQPFSITPEGRQIEANLGVR